MRSRYSGAWAVLFFLLVKACAPHRPPQKTPEQGQPGSSLEDESNKRQRELFDRAATNSGDLDSSRSAELLLREGIAAYSSSSLSSDAAKSREGAKDNGALLERLVEERTKSKIHFAMTLGVQGECPELQRALARVFPYRFSPGSADETLTFHSCELADDSSGDYLVRFDRRIRPRQYARCVERPGTDEPRSYYGGCEPELPAYPGTAPAPPSVERRELRLPAEGSRVRGRLLFLLEFERGKPVRGFSPFGTGVALYDLGIELPTSSEELQSYLRSHPEHREVLREAALRRALELRTHAAVDPLVQLFSSEFCRDFGLHPDELASVMEQNYLALHEEPCEPSEDKPR